MKYFKSQAVELLKVIEDSVTGIGDEDYEDPTKGKDKPRFERGVEKTLLLNCVKLCSNFASLW
jgi:hypothetical protein